MGNIERPKSLGGPVFTLASSLGVVPEFLVGLMSSVFVGVVLCSSGSPGV